MNYVKRLILFLLLLVLPVLLYSHYWKNNTVPLSFVFTSDGHGHILPSREYSNRGLIKIGGIDAVAGYLAGLEDPYILTDSGDCFHGTPEGILTKGAAVINMMNILGYDAAAVGNHEFDLGQEIFRNLSESAEFPFLGSNIIETDTGKIPEYIKSYIIKPIGGINVGIIGVTTPDTGSISYKDNISGLDFLDPAEVLSNNISDMKDKGAHLIVVLSHLGFNADINTVSKVRDVDIILGGHTHRKMKKPVKVKRTLICHPGCHFKNAGHLNVYYSTREKKILAFKYRLIDLLPEKYAGKNTEIKDSIKKIYTGELEGMDEVIGESEIYLPNNFTGDQRKHRELALGNWQADLMRSSTESDFAFQNTGGIRTSIYKGEILVRDIWELSPFGNTLVKMTLTGKQVKELLEQSVSGKYSSLQVSGLRMVYNDSLPQKRRVLNVIITDSEGKSGEIEPDTEYTIVTNSFLAKGGDGYAGFTEGTETEETEIIFRDLEIEYIKQHSPISAAIEKRLQNVTLRVIEDAEQAEQ
ncbi:MAG: bifunctional UDP-sugar hydrolase/5'-nucleotidase [Elusimicrobiota bacterium]